MVLLLSALITATIAILAGSLVRQRSAGIASHSVYDNDLEIDIPSFWKDPQRLRSIFSTALGTRVLGWPSTGGIFVLENCDGGGSTSSGSIVSPNRQGPRIPRTKMRIAQGCVSLEPSSGNPNDNRRRARSAT